MTIFIARERDACRRSIFAHAIGNGARQFQRLSGEESASRHDIFAWPSPEITPQQREHGVSLDDADRAQRISRSLKATVVAIISMVSQRDRADSPGPLAGIWKTTFSTLRRMSAMRRLSHDGLKCHEPAAGIVFWAIISSVWRHHACSMPRRI